jgi:DNA polymerase-3 subunit alpha
MLSAHPGEVPVQLRLRKRDGGNLLLALGPDFKVSNDVAFRSEVKVLLGAGGIE